MPWFNRKFHHVNLYHFGHHHPVDNDRRSDLGVIGSSGLLVTGASTAIVVSVTGGLVINEGLIASNSIAISATASFGLINTGVIATEGTTIQQTISTTNFISTAIQNSGEMILRAGPLIVCQEAGISIVNDGLMSAAQTVITLSAAGSTSLSPILNAGRIITTNTGGIEMVCGDQMSVVNSGEIFSGILSGDGNVRIDTRSGVILERFVFDQVHLIKDDTQHNQRLACLRLPSM